MYATAIAVATSYNFVRQTVRQQRHQIDSVLSYQRQPHRCCSLCAISSLYLGMYVLPLVCACKCSSPSVRLSVHGADRSSVRLSSHASTRKHSSRCLFRRCYCSCSRRASFLTDVPPTNQVVIVLRKKPRNSYENIRDDTGLSIDPIL